VWHFQSTLGPRKAAATQKTFKQKKASASTRWQGDQFFCLAAEIKDGFLLILGHYVVFNGLSDTFYQCKQPSDSTPPLIQ